jgi:hypothetical protein
MSMSMAMAPSKVNVCWGLEDFLTWTCPWACPRSWLRNGRWLPPPFLGRCFWPCSPVLDHEFELGRCHDLELRTISDLDPDKDRPLDLPRHDEETRQGVRLAAKPTRPLIGWPPDGLVLSGFVPIWLNVSHDCFPWMASSM